MYSLSMGQFKVNNGDSVDAKAKSVIVIGPIICLVGSLSNIFKALKFSCIFQFNNSAMLPLRRFYEW